MEIIDSKTAQIMEEHCPEIFSCKKGDMGYARCSQDNYARCYTYQVKQRELGELADKMVGG